MKPTHRVVFRWNIFIPQEKVWGLWWEDMGRQTFKSLQDAIDYINNDVRRRADKGRIVWELQQ
jgi:hypothetical protein